MSGSNRIIKWTAWSIVVLSFVVHGIGQALVMYLGEGLRPVTVVEWVVHVIYAVAFLSFPVVGALIVSRHPRNLVGWILTGAGLLWAFSGTSTIYADITLVIDPGIFPHGGMAAGWLANWLHLPGTMLVMTLLLLLFPTGQLPSRRWRLVVWLILAGLTVVLFTGMFRPGELTDIQGVDNPLGIGNSPDIWLTIEGIGFVALAIASVACAVSMVLRLRRSVGIERQQLKWFAYTAALVAFAYVELIIGYGLFDQSIESLRILFSVTWLSIPTAVGIAILRHRLYDIDVIINRTIVYGILSAVLAGVYYVSVITFGQLFQPFAQGSSLALTGSTLAAAVVFQPARGRIQVAVDRRFYRVKYDAARAIESFSATLRQEIDLDSLTTELVAVVQETVQPSYVSLWLRLPGDTAVGRRALSDTRM